MFEPSHFLAVAGWLLDGPQTDPAWRSMREARVRTAYGRAYYALYLLVRNELERRHKLRTRALAHGAVYTHLQSSQASEEVRQLGRELQRLYTLRQKADYELVPIAEWEKLMADERFAAELVVLAAEWSPRLSRLDFSPVVTLFDSRR